MVLCLVDHLKHTIFNRGGQKGGLLRSICCHCVGALDIWSIEVAWSHHRSGKKYKKRAIAWSKRLWHDDWKVG